MAVPGSPSRNDPCPCGSGRKYKSCCLRQAGSVRAAPAVRAVHADPTAEIHAARAAQQAGNLAGAERMLRAVVERHPREKAALFGLGEVLGQLGRPDDGVALVRRAIAAGDRRPAAHLLLAELLLAARQPDAAIESASAALAIDPRRARGHRIIATAHELSHRLDDALAAAKRAVHQEPGDALCVAMLARVHRRRGDLEAARALLEPLAERGAAPGAGGANAAAAQLHYELGAVRERLGDARGAYAAFRRAGEIQLDSPPGRRIDRTEAPRTIASFRAAVTPELVRRFRAEDLADGGPPPAFLVGFPRSGTTLTEQIMGAHPDVATAGERLIVPAVLEELRHIAGSGDAARDLAQIDLAGARRLRARYRAAAEELAEELARGRILVDKLPLNIVYLGLINVIFPEARVIVALRDPRDVCLSCFMQYFELNEAMIQFCSMPAAARFYAGVMELWLHQRTFLTLRFAEIRYEDTVVDLEGQARRILDVLGVPWDDAVLSFQESARERFISTPSYAAVSEKVHTRAVARWKRYAEVIEPEVFTTLAPFVKAFGYE
jgi:tetratricopeptide (TPR) repeat protein